MTADVLFTGGGEMGERIRQLDWSQTLLGPVSGWPQSLITAVSIMLGSKFPMMIHWGPELVHFYNDGYATIMLNKHPGALGQPAYPWWSEMWPFLTPIFDKVWAGETTYFENQLVLPNRQGFVEETYFTFSHSPLHDEAGQVAGIYVTALETTTTVLNQRRLAMLSTLTASAALAAKPAEAVQHLIASLATNTADIPFSLLYTIEQDAQQAHLAGWFGLPAGKPAAPATITLQATESWPIGETLRTRQPVLVHDLAGRFATWPVHDWPVPPTRALLLPLVSAEAGMLPVREILIVGLSARRPFDEDYRGFFSLVSDYAGRALQHAATIHEAHRLNQDLQEANTSLDAFVHIAAHDLKGPVGNLQGLLEVYNEDAPDHAQIMRLLSQEVNRLEGTVSGLLEVLRSQHTAVPTTEEVNLAAAYARVSTSLADYLRTQNGHIITHFPEDAATVTCPPAYLESILKNLLHNALKYRAPDRSPLVHLSSARRGEFVVLTVADNGVGIDLTRNKNRLFSPFTRLTPQGEGAGLGLYMVRNLVQQQGGNIEVSSKPDVGTTFTVLLPAPLLAIDL